MDKRVGGTAAILVALLLINGYSSGVNPSAEQSVSYSSTSTTAARVMSRETYEEVTSETSADSSTDTTEDTIESTAVVEQDPLPEVSADDWFLMLVGPDHVCEEDIPEANLATISNGAHQVDKRILADYEALAEAAKKAGFPLVTISAYRAYSYQEQIFGEAIQQTMSSENLSEEDARKKVMETMTEPGHSEHQIGLAIDVVDEDWYGKRTDSLLDASYGKEPGAKWLAEHAADYGFIIRYPEGKESITKITYEPWHLRYVGKESAAYITQHELTLEEYLDLLKEK